MNEMDKILEKLSTFEDLSETNIFERAKAVLKEKDPYKYKEWEEDNFNPDHLFKLRYVRDVGTLLYFACQYNDERIVKCLIDTKTVDLNAHGGHLETTSPLMTAVQKRSQSIVKMLLEAGANVNESNKEGRTPLYYAIRKKEIDIIKILLKNGANPNALDSSGNTLLCHAAMSCNINIIKILLKNGADVNAGNIWVTGDNCSGKLIQSAAFIVQYITKMKIAGLEISSKTVERQKNSYIANYAMGRINHPEHSEACQAEVEKMQQVKIGESDISHHQFLLEIGHLNNPDVRKGLETGQYKEEFPLYADLIESQYNKAKKKIKERFLHTCEVFINYLSKHYECNFNSMTLTEMEDFLEKHKDDHLDIMEDRDLPLLGSFINASHLYSPLPLKTLALNQEIQNQLNNPIVEQAQKPHALSI